MKAKLIKRLDQIALSLASTNEAVALVVVGSLGEDMSRVDAFSDLDFFVITRDGYAQTLINDLFWLERVHKVAYSFKNTVDGYKVLFSDGIYAEFAVFNESILEKIPYTNARIHWQKANYPFVLKQSRYPLPESPSSEYLFNEALTNIYVGLQRLLRGERYASYIFICHHALTNVIKARDQMYDVSSRDPFDVSRRLEVRQPELIPLLENTLNGYQNIMTSARGLLDYIRFYDSANSIMIKEIERLIVKGEMKENHD